MTISFPKATRAVASSLKRFISNNQDLKGKNPYQFLINQLDAPELIQLHAALTPRINRILGQTNVSEALGRDLTSLIEIGDKDNLSFRLSQSAENLAYQLYDCMLYSLVRDLKDMTKFFMKQLLIYKIPLADLPVQNLLFEAAKKKDFDAFKCLLYVCHNSNADEIEKVKHIKSMTKKINDVAIKLLDQNHYSNALDLLTTIAEDESFDQTIYNSSFDKVGLSRIEFALNEFIERNKVEKSIAIEFRDSFKKACESIEAKFDMLGDSDGLSDSFF